MLEFWWVIINVAASSCNRTIKTRVWQETARDALRLANQIGVEGTGRQHFGPENSNARSGVGVLGAEGSQETGQVTQRLERPTQHVFKIRWIARPIKVGAYLAEHKQLQASLQIAFYCRPDKPHFKPGHRKFHKQNKYPLSNEWL